MLVLLVYAFVLLFGLDVDDDVEVCPLGGLVHLHVGEGDGLDLGALGVSGRDGMLGGGEEEGSRRTSEPIGERMMCCPGGS